LGLSIRSWNTKLQDRAIEETHTTLPFINSPPTDVAPSVDELSIYRAGDRIGISYTGLRRARYTVTRLAGSAISSHWALDQLLALDPEDTDRTARLFTIRGGTIRSAPQPPSWILRSYDHQKKPIRCGPRRCLRVCLVIAGIAFVIFAILAFTDRPARSGA